jgi:hypothetical protein
LSVPEELKGRKGDMLAARIMTPIVLAIIYGIYEFIARGASSDFYLYTYVPVLGGVAATAGLMTYHLRVASPNFAKISWKNLLVLLGFLPYLFLIYVIGFLGLYTIYKGVMVSFSMWTILAGVFWVAIGYRGINQFYLMTGIVGQHSKTHPPIR